MVYFSCHFKDKNAIGAPMIIDENENNTITIENQTINSSDTDEIVSLKNSLAKATQQLLYAKADIENIRKNNIKEIHNEQMRTLNRVVTAFLDPFDSIERCLKSEINDEKTKTGIEMIYQAFIKGFNELGITIIDEKQGFSPHMHEIISVVKPKDHTEIIKVDNEKNNNTNLSDEYAIIEVLRKGFVKNTSLIRAAQVVVESKNK